MIPLFVLLETVLPSKENNVAAIYDNAEWAQRRSTAIAKRRCAELAAQIEQAPNVTVVFFVREESDHPQNVLSRVAIIKETTTVTPAGYIYSEVKEMTSEVVFYLDVFQGCERYRLEDIERLAKEAQMIAEEADWKINYQLGETTLRVRELESCVEQTENLYNALSEELDRMEEQHQNELNRLLLQLKTRELELVEMEAELNSKTRSNVEDARDFEGWRRLADKRDEYQRTRIATLESQLAHLERSVAAASPRSFIANKLSETSETLEAKQIRVLEELRGVLVARGQKPAH